MDYLFIAKLRLKELRKQWKFSVIFLISLMVSLAFLVLFVAKFMSIADSFHQANLKQTEDIWYASQSPIIDSFWQSDEDQLLAQIQKSRLIANISGDNFSARVVGLNPEVAAYFRDLEIPQSFKNPSHQVLVPESFLLKHHLNLGDSIRLSDYPFVIQGSHQSYYFRDSFIIPLNTLLTPNNSYEEVLILDPSQSQDQNLIQSVQNHGYQVSPILKLESDEKQSLFNFLIFVGFMSSCFSFLAFINCLMSFDGRRLYLQRNQSIHRLVGSTARQQAGILFVEHLLLGVIALQLALLLLVLTRNWIPQYFRVYISWPLFLLAQFIMLVIISFFSYYAYRKMSFNNLIVVFKEVA